MSEVIKNLKATAMLLLCTLILTVTVCAFAVASDIPSKPAPQNLIAANDDGSEPFGGGE